MFKIIKKVLDVICILFIIVLAIYAFLRFTNKAIIYEVKTGSMEDGIHAGDYILVIKKNNYKVGDIVTYRQGEYFVTHRIIKKTGSRVVTKGDANNIEDDEINVKSIVGKVIYSDGYLNFVIDYKYAIASILFALYLFSCYFSKKDDEIGEDSFLLELNKDDALKNDVLSEEKTEDIIEKDLLKKNNKEENGENIQPKEIDDEEDVKIKRDLSFIYDNDKNKKKIKRNK